MSTLLNRNLVVGYNSRVLEEEALLGALWWSEKTTKNDNNK
jgi:hypothetical protein